MSKIGYNHIMIGHIPPEAALANSPKLRKMLDDCFKKPEAEPVADKEATPEEPRCPVEDLGFEAILSVLADSNAVEIMYPPLDS